MKVSVLLWVSLAKLSYDDSNKVSMIDGTFFDKLEEIARNARENGLPFGGMQVNDTLSCYES